MVRIINQYVAIHLNITIFRHSVKKNKLIVLDLNKTLWKKSEDFFQTNLSEDQVKNHWIVQSFFWVENLQSEKRKTELSPCLSEQRRTYVMLKPLQFPEVKYKLIWCPPPSSWRVSREH